ncbi:hypothetical protein NDU88_002609 [Pleurodeles waltl]|uniref:Uncharacterized protein n=1 Tax=Pleurodeles waltl TaxID=8319 RepID=A0AAV7W068_PLEWA|nr:hypothetical protein NDU88_002609 [Pleurodeles waltl]
MTGREDAKQNKETETGEEGREENGVAEHDMEKSDDRGEQSGKPRTEKDATTEAEMDREPPGEPSNSGRPCHVPRGTWLHKDPIQNHHKIEEFHNLRVTRIIKMDIEITQDDGFRGHD